MITNHEDITYEITAKERLLLPAVIEVLKKKIGKKRAAKGPNLCISINYAHTMLTGEVQNLKPVRLRKIIHFLRMSGEAGIICSGQIEYYIAEDITEAASTAISLQQRANSMQEAATAVNMLIAKSFNNQKNV